MIHDLLDMSLVIDHQTIRVEYKLIFLRIGTPAISFLLHLLKMTDDVKIIVNVHSEDIYGVLDNDVIPRPALLAIASHPLCNVLSL